MTQNDTDTNSPNSSTIQKKPKKIKRPKQHYPLVEVIWDDAAGLRHGWEDKTTTPSPQTALSVGFLIIDSPDHIVIAQDTDADGSHNGRTQIPRGMVKQIKVLRKADNGKKKE